MIMKRRRVGNQDQSKGSNVADGQKNFASVPGSGGNQLNDPPCMLNTVFEVLLPLEPKISDNHSIDYSRISNESVMTNTIMGKTQFNFCKKCGGLEDYCKCVGSGDFESITPYIEPLKEKIVKKTSESITNDTIIEKEYEPSSQEESLEQSSTLQNEEAYFSSTSLLENQDLNTSTGSVENKDDTFSNLEEDLNGLGINVAMKKGNLIHNILEETTSDQIGSCKGTENSLEIKNDVEVEDREESLKNINELGENFISVVQSCDEEVNVDRKNDNLTPQESLCEFCLTDSDVGSQTQSSVTVVQPKILGAAAHFPPGVQEYSHPTRPLLTREKTEPMPEMQNTNLNAMGEGISWIDEQKSETMICGNTSKISVSNSTRSTKDLPSEDGDSIFCDGLQVFEQMDLDDIHLEISPKMDSSLLDDLKEADRKSKKTAHLINQIKDSIKKFQSKENLTEEDTLVIKIKQVELAKKLAEFEDITRRVQNLVGLAELNNIEHTVTVTSIGDDQAAKSKSTSSLESVHEDPQTVLEDVDESQREVSSQLSETEDTFVGDASRDGYSKVEEMEVIQTKSNFPPSASDNKLSYLRKDNEVTNFLMMDKIIPKVIVCGSQDSMPRVIVCEKPNVQPESPPPYSHPPPLFPDYVPPFPFKEGSLFDKKTEVPEMMISLTGRLSESYLLQEKLATENAALEDGRYLLQEELLKRDNIVDALQQKVGCLQTEMRIIAKENLALQEKLEGFNNMDSCTCNRKVTKPPSRAAAVPQYGNTCQLERQLNMIEGEVRTMQSELQQVQKERQQLEQQRKLLKCTGGGGPVSGPAKKIQVTPCVPKSCTCGPNAALGRGENPEQLLRDLKEQYARLEDDFKNKVAEVSALRRDVDKWKSKCETAKEGQEAAEQECRCLQTQLKSAEQDKKKMLGSREQMIEQEQQLNVAKQRFREAQDELEELRALIQDQTTQLEDYRNKYLQAQQQVEEQRRQIDVMEMENSRISDQVNLEIQRVKAQFQEKLQELTPLPDILKATQLKLQECQQARLLADRNCEDLASELQNHKDQIDGLRKEIDNNNKPIENEDIAKLDALDAKCAELKEENARLRSELIRLDEIAAQAQRRLEEKSHDAAQLAAQLDTVREESARQVARTKDRAETMRRSLQCQISEMERQLAQSRATARSAQKDRDEIRQRMQCQINNLNESFEQAQMRIRSLQSHVNFLKSSYSNIFEPNATNPAIECACPNVAQDFNF